jgi:hypothetical protein
MICAREGGLGCPQQVAKQHYAQSTRETNRDRRMFMLASVPGVKVDHRMSAVPGMRGERAQGHD